ncbi:hypothetical protein NDU88_001384 [Pleurodeles waltl]|uniref:Uncharacterized protein n=1 Tax=Pleurodeles waltl TaxID=8319 RepID=A0AAV7LXH2_PLEWA|nr:hypothetical protein NDU88_001384 [Pleurodeles waltl]
MATIAVPHSSTAFSPQPPLVNYYDDDDDDDDSQPNSPILEPVGRPRQQRVLSANRLQFFMIAHGGHARKEERIRTRDIKLVNPPAKSFFFFKSLTQCMKIKNVRDVRAIEKIWSETSDQQGDKNTA